MRPLPLALLLVACVVPPFDATGKDCAEAACPASLSCVLGTCHPEGETFCDGLTGMTVCDEFAGGVALDAGWDGLERRGTGEFLPDTSRFVSPPTAMRSELKGTGGTEIGRARRFLAEGFTRARVEFDVFFDESSVVSSTMASVVEFYCLGTVDGSNRNLGAWFRRGPEGWLLRNGFAPTSIAIDVPEMRDDAWVRVGMEVLPQEAIAHLAVDGKRAASVALFPCNLEAPEITVGLGGGSPARAWFDNVVLRVE